MKWTFSARRIGDCSRNRGLAALDRLARGLRWLGAMFAPTRETPLLIGARFASLAARALRSLAARGSTEAGRVSASVERPSFGAQGECEVSVLFADLRGYTRYSESRRPADVFQRLEAYADRASKIVSAHGGRILSFHGDGLLAVFDAADKERAAYRTALELVHAVSEPDDLPSQPEPGELPIGIGIATGRAFLGRIGSGPGATWSATGDPTNVAARLQALSRSFRSPILMDRPTFVCVATPCTPHPGVAIRGRTAPVDVYTPVGTSQRPGGRDVPVPAGCLSEVGASLRRAPAGALG
jgi:class 3 adenylate cyclase